jgi:hypothetical protein
MLSLVSCFNVKILTFMMVEYTLFSCKIMGITMMNASLKLRKEKGNICSESCCAESSYMIADISLCGMSLQ